MSRYGPTSFWTMRMRKFSLVSVRRFQILVSVHGHSIIVRAIARSLVLVTTTVIASSKISRNARTSSFVVTKIRLSSDEVRGLRVLDKDTSLS
jgi:hypothetical protein